MVLSSMVSGTERLMSLLQKQTDQFRQQLPVSSTRWRWFHIWNDEAEKLIPYNENGGRDSDGTITPTWFTPLTRVFTFYFCWEHACACCLLQLLLLIFLLYFMYVCTHFIFILILICWTFFFFTFYLLSDSDSMGAVTRARCHPPALWTALLCWGWWAAHVCSLGPSPKTSWCSWRRRSAPALKHSSVKCHMTSRQLSVTHSCTTWEEDRIHSRRESSVLTRDGVLGSFTGDLTGSPDGYDSFLLVESFPETLGNVVVPQVHENLYTNTLPADSISISCYVDSCHWYTGLDSWKTRSFFKVYIQDVCLRFNWASKPSFLTLPGTVFILTGPVVLVMRANMLLNTPAWQRHRKNKLCVPNSTHIITQIHSRCLLISPLN